MCRERRSEVAVREHEGRGGCDLSEMEEVMGRWKRRKRNSREVRVGERTVGARCKYQ